MSGRAVAAALVLLASRAPLAEGREVRLDGSARVRGLYSTSAPGDPAVRMSFLDLDARAADLTDSGLQLQLDATFVLDEADARERRFGRTESLDQVRQLFVRQPDLAGALDVAVGRRLIADAGNAWVDGLELVLNLDERRAAVAAYGGLSPDPLTYAPTAERQATGLYGTLHRGGLDAALAWNGVLREGRLDRHFVFNRLHYRVAPGLFVASYVVVDLVLDPQPTTLLASVDYTPVPPLNLTLNLSRYAVEQYRDQQIYRNVVEPNQALVLGDEVVDLVYERARFSASFRFWGALYHYQSVEYKNRAQDGLDAWVYVIGLRNDDLFGLGTRVDLHGRLNNDFQSDAWLAGLEAEQELSPAWTLAARATWFDGRTVGRATERGRLFDEAQTIYLVGLGIFWQPARRHRLDVDYDGVYEAELQDQRNQDNLLIHTLMGRYGFYF